MNNREPNIDPKLLKPYNPLETEDRIYKLWEESGFFNPDVCIEKGITKPKAKPFSIVLPPPNVTGTLHIGHASMLAIEDIMIRYARMRGRRTLWLPGTDHAAIATQSKVEKILEKEGVRKNDLGREEFLKRVEKFAQESHNTIVNQVRKMGASIDWSREAYTLDDKRNLAVRTAFKKMYDDGLIYRGHRIVNWDPKGQTVISDDEIIYKEEKTKFYYLKYGPFIIGTARPETKFGDKYVVMHPADERYKEYKDGQKIELEWINGPITATIIKDEGIDMEFGTGVMTITPWHSAADFEIALRHNLDREQIIDKYGKLLPIAGEFAGMKIKEARDKIVEKLQAKGLVDKIEDYTHNIATAERTEALIEPQIMNQWFVNVNKPIKDRGNKSLKELMLEPVRNSQIKILPDRFEKVYFNWIENLRDWCISRQIWYGHRIPVWYREDKTYCGIEAPSGDGWQQDEDTLDTWFSSGLWTFSTLGWPDTKAPDLKAYHPTTVLETGYDIIFFWVARMILMSTYIMGEIPFETVYLHGLIRDVKGRKMTKSLGNVIDPLDVIRKYGADAVRMSLIIGTGPGNDSKMSEDKIRAYKNYANKLWNIARFVLSNAEDIKYDENFENYSKKDLELMEERHLMLEDITKDINDFRFYLAGEKLYQYTWSRFADVIIEDSKKIFENGAAEEIISRKQFLIHTLCKIIACLHPFMPFVTEEIWSVIPIKDNKKLLMVTPWPIHD
ncbi:MAG TPA: valine--tRNA ligase [Candidatus Paceibacterota bacterium]|nr:valine--tRNA ligase [Candidatus Paceibacterota bacterium]